MLSMLIMDPLPWLIHPRKYERWIFSATSVNNSRHTLRNTPEERRSHLHLSRSPNPRTVIYNLTLFIPQELPYRFTVSLLTCRIINRLFKLQFGVVKCVVPLAYFTSVNQKITSHLIRYVALFVNFKPSKNTERNSGAKLQWPASFKTS